MKIIDIHCHMLPDVDDGASGKSEAQKMMALQKEQGVVGIIVTPHYRIGFCTPDFTYVQKQYKWLKTIAKSEEIKLWLGCECFARDDMMDGFRDGKYATMAGSTYVLIEFSEQHSFTMVMQYIGKVISAGYTPIIAHAERIECLYNKQENIEELKRMGACIQVNASSVLGVRSFRIKRVMKKWLTDDLISFIASDCHNTKDRVPNLGKCYRYVEKKMGKEYAKTVFYRNPYRLLAEAKKVE